MALALTMLPGSVAAEEMSNAEAVSQFQKVQATAGLLTHEKPRFQDVRLAIAADCHEKVGAEATAFFCYCAGALTLNLWYNNLEMRERLKAFSAAVSESPRDLLRYQGPELYTPFCHKVVAGMAAAH